MKKFSICRRFVFHFFIIALSFSSNAQYTINTATSITIVGFYNFENFYDTTDQLQVSDEEFLPNSAKGYNSVLYNNKSMHLASVIYGMGKIENANGVSLLGIAEIENKNVLKKIADEPLIQKYHYQFIHFDSKDTRGIDVALMYHPQYFKPYQYRSYSLTDANHFINYATRDILYVQGLLNNTWVHILVNHWPSRRGGEKASMDKRMWASMVCKKIMDSIENRDPFAKFIVMGDFNDNPNNKSIQQLNMYNPFLSLFKRGMGSMAYRDSWSLFDQILLSKLWMKDDCTLVGKEQVKNKKKEPEKEYWTRTEHHENQKSLPTMAEQKWDSATLKKAGNPEFKEIPKNNYDLIYCKSIIYRSTIWTEKEGKYQGYPKRTWNGDQFMGGYSDHYPAVIIFKSKNGEKPLK